MVCHIAGYLGCSPSDVYALPATDVDLLRRFYEEEPWGAWRDNLHAAIIAREVRAHRTGRRADLRDFMYKRPEARRAENVSGFVAALRAMAGNKRRHVSEVKLAKRGKRGSSKTSRPARSAKRPTS